MTKKTNLLISLTLVSTLALSALSPAAYAFGQGRNNMQNPNGAKPMQQMQQIFNQMHKRSHQQMQNKPFKRGGAPLGLIRVACNEKAPEMLEKRLNKIAEKLELTEEQKPLFEDLRTASLAAQTDFLDVCTIPEKGEEIGFIERVKIKNSNLQAIVDASNKTLPALEAFINSLSDEQKAKLKKGKQKRGHFGPRKAPNRGPNNG